MKKMIGLSVAAFFALTVCVPGLALSSERSYMYDADGISYSAPVAYEMVRTVYGEDIGATSFDKPQDLHVADGCIYIADTGNNRIVVTNERFCLVKTIEYGMSGGKRSELNQPCGVYKADDGLLYICDTGNFRIIALDDGQNIVKEIKGDHLTSVNKNFQFKPQKIAVGRESDLYVVAPEVYQGIMHYRADGTFMGFFAPNDVEVTAAVRLVDVWKNIFSEEQQDKLEKTLPSPYNNVFIGKDRYIYTTADNVPVGDEIKCINQMGKNILHGTHTGASGLSFGDLETSYENGALVKSRFVDVYANGNGLLCVLDRTRGRIFQYDSECNLLCVFGGNTSYGGCLREPVALEGLGDRYLVLDAQTNTVTVYAPTPYMCAVLDALHDYSAGNYLQSLEKWESILKQNSHYVLAYRSIGRACLQQGDYKNAMKMLQKGDDKYFYSMALKEYRKEYLRDNFWWTSLLGVLLIVGLVVGVKHLRRWLLMPRSNRVAVKKGGKK